MSITGARNRATRRGAALAAVVIALSLMSLLVLASAGSGEEASESDALRVETARAFFAADSGATVLIGLTASGAAFPEAGEIVDLGVSEFEVIELPAGSGGDAVIEGRSGFASRRVLIGLE